MKNDDVVLENITKLFEYEKVSRDIDNIDNIDDLKTIAKMYVKLYFKQQEVLSNFPTEI